MEYNPHNETRSELNPFFYGVTLVHKPESYTYQADALSANFGLNESYYNRQQTYRVEWEPPEEDGSGGYIRWYTNDIFLYGVSGKNLNITGTEIPSEAMYLIMNTAVASSWGFAVPCPEGCKCDCFECGNPDCACALPDRYCQNFPAFFEIDYVRVYQAKNEPKHILGCSPESKPTELFIKGHRNRYMERGDWQPLQPIVHGGASCDTHAECGGHGKGRCSEKGTCECHVNFTGPNCLAHAGFYVNESRGETEMTIGCECFNRKAGTFFFPSTWYSFVVMLLLLFCWCCCEKGAYMYLPTSLISFCAIIAIGLCVAMMGVIKEKKKDGKYPKIGGSIRENPMQKVPMSYQSSSDYVLPPQQKVVTYCVIDGKLVD